MGYANDRRGALAIFQLFRASFRPKLYLRLPFHPSTSTHCTGFSVLLSRIIVSPLSVRDLYGERAEIR